MNRNILMVVLLMVLVIVSAVQAFQLNDLKGKVSSGTIGKTVSPVAVQSGASGNSINELPSMVGGC